MPACATSARPILTVAELAAADRASVEAGVPIATLMRRAGRAVADAVQARWSRRPVVVLCGPGDNGGDGFVAARRLAEAGWPVRVAAASAPRRSAAAAEAVAGWTGPVEPLRAEAVDGAALVIDALFGAGLKRPLEGAHAGALRAAERTGAPIVAVDLPSGLDGDAGRPLDYAPACVLTVSFHAKKPAHVLEPGRGLCGEVVIADIGLPAPAPASPALSLFENGPALWAQVFPWPSVDAHKSQRGHLVVVSGDASATGAARLSARGGLRIGAGLVTVLSPPDALPINAAALEAVMVRPFADADALHAHAERARAVVIGPGAGVTPETAANVRALARTEARLVLDADALTVFRDEPEALFALVRPHDVLTPHPGEFERIFPGLLAAAPERIAAAREAARRAGCVVLLKGADTVIAAPDGRAAVNGSAAPWLATAGSGDVLAGFIGGLSAQGMDGFEAACAGAWIHGRAGRGFGPGLIAEDLPEQAPVVLRDLLRRRSAAAGADRAAARCSEPHS